MTSTEDRENKGGLYENMETSVASFACRDGYDSWILRILFLSICSKYSRAQHRTA
ncbi:hypothetical protein EMIT07CA2_170071 [Brevibacillus sp. IT-7CA2]